jgi:raffinose/stachyose/melibiose transport system permease protein
VWGLVWQLLLTPTTGLIDQILWDRAGAWSKAWLGEPDTAIFAVIFVASGNGPAISWHSSWSRSAPCRATFTRRWRSTAPGRAAFWHITVPGVRETILIVTIITILGSLKVFDIVWVMTAGGPNHSSEVLGTLMYRAAFRDDMIGYSSTIATVIFFIALTIGLVQIKLQKDR